MRRTHHFWILITGLTLMPLAAHAAPTPAASPVPPAQASSPHDLTLQEANDTFIHFDAGKVGQDPDDTATIFGMVHEACRDKFQFSTVTKPTAELPGVIGFTIRDLGGGAECESALPRSCSASNPCVRISHLAGGSIDLKGVDDVQIKLIHSDPNDDRHPVKGDDFTSPLFHKSAATIAAERALEAAQRRDAEIKLYREQVSACRKSTEELYKAYTALDGLSSLGALKEGEFDKIEHELALAELSLIAKQAQKAPLDEMEEVKEQLESWASDHPNEADRVATVFHQIAIRQTQAGTPEAFDDAMATLKEAKENLELSDRASYALDNDMRDFQVSKGIAYAKSGGMNNMALWGSPWAPGYYQSLMNDLYTQASNCKSLEDCSNVAGALQNAATIPLRARTVDYQRCVRQEQINRMIAQSMGQPQQPQPGPQMPGMPNSQLPQQPQQQYSQCGPAPQTNGMGSMPGLTPIGANNMPLSQFGPMTAGVGMSSLGTQFGVLR